MKTITNIIIMEEWEEVAIMQALQIIIALPVDQLILLIIIKALAQIINILKIFINLLLPLLIIIIHQLLIMAIQLLWIIEEEAQMFQVK